METTDWQVTRYVPARHGLDFLIYLWRHADQAGEALRFFNRTTPLALVRDYADTLMLVVHQDDRVWRDGSGMLGAAWIDDIVPHCRGHAHFWVAPAWRQPLLLDTLSADVLGLLFETAAVTVLCGFIATTNVAACRTVERWGFTCLAVLPNATLDTHPDPTTLSPVDAGFYALTLEAFHARWQPVMALDEEGH